MFPQLSDILNNTSTFGESLPTTSRALNFRVTARDNRSGGGGVADDAMVVTVDSTSGPFVVTAPNTAVIWAGGTVQAVTWNVAGTSAAPVSAANVNVLLSTDSGHTYPFTLASSTPNDGAQDITVPNLTSGSARVRVEAVGNVFFDVSDTDFTINTSGCSTITLSPSSLPAGVIGAAYNQQITASGGTASYSYSVTLGMPPPGLTLALDGSLTGTPTASGSFSFSVTATDSNLCTGAGSYQVAVSNTSGCPAITLSPSSLQAGVIGTFYSQQITGSGGTAPYNFALSSGALPSGLVLASDGSLTGTPTAVGSFSFSVTATDSNLCTGNAPYLVSVTSSTCLFCDDFENGVLDPSWTYIKPAWTESGGTLIGAPTGRKAIAIASPAFGGCGSCTVEAPMQSAGGIGNRVWLLAWYVDKGNTIELMMKEENDRWILKQRVGGPVVVKAKGVLAIDPGVSYDARIVFDGAQFQVFINNALLITLPKAGGTTPFGTVGFESKNTTAAFQSIDVN